MRFLRRTAPLTLDFSLSKSAPFISLTGTPWRLLSILEMRDELHIAGAFFKSSPAVVTFVAGQLSKSPMKRGV